MQVKVWASQRPEAAGEEWERVLLPLGRRKGSMLALNRPVFYQATNLGIVSLCFGWVYARG